MEQRIDNGIYDTLGERWYHAFDDPVALLRLESKAKIPWVMEKMALALPNANVPHILDVGCGGGFISNALAREGFVVTGVDQSQDSISIAKKYDETGRARYLCADASCLPFPDESFDVVLAMDFLEHVDDPSLFVIEMGRVLRPGGLFFFHTFNRNPLAYVIIIKMVKLLVANTPKNMHVIDLFIKPAELRVYCRQGGMEVLEMTGIKPVFSSLTLSSLLKRSVPPTFRFKLTKSTLLSYMGYARKDGRESIS